MIKIYKIIDNTNGNVYVGKTTQKYLSNRISTHRKDYKNAVDGKRYHLTSSQIIKNGDYRIELIEETDDETREKYWILNTDCCINKNMPGRTAKEWRKDNKESLKIKKAAHYLRNRDKNLEQFKQYREYRNSWGGDPRYDNNLLKIDVNLFTS